MCAVLLSKTWGLSCVPKGNVWSLGFIQNCSFVASDMLASGCVSKVAIAFAASQTCFRVKLSHCMQILGLQPGLFILF